MPYVLRPVEEADAESLIRECDWPAFRNDALRRCMFPVLDGGAAEEECIRWNIAAFKKSIREGKVRFVKACDESGSPAGYIGWSGETGRVTASVSNDGAKSTVNEPLPDLLDEAAWLNLQRILREDSKKVSKEYPSAWRLCTMSVNPAYQRQGIGTLLVQWVCDQVAENDCYVTASPAALRLYQSFGFEKVDEIRTPNWMFTSMLRKAKKTPEHQIGQLPST